MNSLRAAKGKGLPNYYQKKLRTSRKNEKTKQKYCSTITVRFNHSIANSMELPERNSIVTDYFFSNRQNLARKLVIVNYFFIFVFTLKFLYSTYSISSTDNW